MTSKKVVGILGGGQLGRMLVEPANRHNIQTNILDKGNAPAKRISDGKHIDGTFSDREAVKALAKTVDVLTVEIEHIDTYALEEVAKEVEVQPHWRTLRIIQNKFRQKQHLQEYDVAMAEFEEVDESSKTSQGLQAIGKKLGLPFMLKAQTQAYDGKGNFPIKSETDIDAALQALGKLPLYAEKWATFKAELAVMVVKTKDEVLSFPTVETFHEDSICKLVYAPARNVSDKVNEDAQSLARKAIAAFEGKGVFGVEMFLLENDTLLINEIAPRPHNSGHYTIEACPMSQYEAHLRAILDMPISQNSLRLREPSIMLNILGGEDPESHIEVAKAALSIPGASIHLYEKGQARPGRKMGHVTLTAPSMADCELTLQPLVDLTDRIRAARTDIGPAHSQTQPKSTGSKALIGVTMGSDSDLKVLIPGLTLLEDEFGLSVDVAITSAHRTPEWMEEYGRSAVSRGLKVLICAAGGSAHLPGMMASATSLPVIGVPVKASVLDGVDSVYSMLQMPPGVPCAVTGINNSRNAALYAVRILAAYDTELQKKYDHFVRKQSEEVIVKNHNIRETGWKAYHKSMQNRSQ
jgi:phosphoribosylaminoimidazole carboxylase